MNSNNNKSNKNNTILNYAIIVQTSYYCEICLCAFEFQNYAAVQHYTILVYLQQKVKNIRSCVQNNLLSVKYNTSPDLNLPDFSTNNGSLIFFHCVYLIMYHSNSASNVHSNQIKIICES